MRPSDLTQEEPACRQGVAIVGMAGRFPGARDVDAFWANIKNGVESITRFSPDQLEVPIPPEASAESASRYVCAKGLLDDIDLFDARFFGYLPRDAEVMDPQHRVFLELCWQALEHAGTDAARYDGAIGVYAGCYMDTYVLANLCADDAFRQRLVESIQVGSLQTELGNDKDYLATRVAYKLGLRGPAMTLQTACSTSLVAVATACQSLEAYACDMALAGGITIVLPQYKGYVYKEGGMLSGDGRCRTFDAAAQGTVFSNGAAVIVLKRLEDALADGDAVYAVIKGYATNNDGGAKVSYTAPSVEGQAEVIELAHALADIDPATIGYVEAHGTATPMGDPIEIAGLTQAFRARSDCIGTCAIGSVKPNLGHLDVASGAIGLIKAALAVHEAVLPPLLHFETPNPKIDFAQTPFYVPRTLGPWPERVTPRRAGVSSFGVGGTNAHVVIEQAPTCPADANARPYELLVLSARSPAALDAQAQQLAAHLDSHPEQPLADIASTLQIGRRAFEHRRVVVAEDHARTAAALRAKPMPETLGQPSQAEPALILMFPGQGAQYPAMARELYASEPLIRETIDAVADAVLDTSAGTIDIRKGLLWTPEGNAEAEETMAATLRQTAHTQPALFAREIALARWLESVGLRASAMIGHSVGEFAAACLAGVFSLDDAARLVTKRGMLMQAQPAGSMAAVRAGYADITRRLPADLAIAAINAPELCAVSGTDAAVASFVDALAAEGIQASKLATSHAFHSPMMAAAHDPLVAALETVTRREPDRPIYLTGGAGSPADPAYWGQQLLAPVRFADALMAAAEAHPGAVFVDVGPGQTLSTLARQTLDPTVHPARALSGPSQAPGSALAHALSGVGKLWVLGIEPDWPALAPGKRKRVPLPTYPFERKRYWVDAPVPAVAGDAATSLAPVAARAAAPSVEADQPDAVADLIARQLEVIRAQLRALSHE